ncbi:MAG: ArsR/SmtB family transcription factor [Actinomycetota bacterium]
MDELARRAELFKALGDPLRLSILDRLAAGPRCVCDLREELSIAGNLLSHHLKVLREAGLVRSERQGRWVTYAVEADALEAARQALPGQPLALVEA